MEKDEFGAKMRKGKTPTKIIEIEGVGTMIQYGEWDVKKLATKLLQEKSIIR